MRPGETALLRRRPLLRPPARPHPRHLLHDVTPCHALERTCGCDEHAGQISERDTCIGGGTGIGQAGQQQALSGADGRQHSTLLQGQQRSVQAQCTGMAADVMWYGVWMDSPAGQGRQDCHRGAQWRMRQHMHVPHQHHRTPVCR